MPKYFSLVGLILCSVSSHSVAQKPINEGTEFDSFCGLNARAAELAWLIINHPNQLRAQLKCHPILAVTSAEKAKQMAIDQRIQHHLNHQSPNQLLKTFGYELPKKYPNFGNQVESIAGGYKNQLKALQAFLNSDGHRTHLLGIHEFYTHQIHIGVGYYYDPQSPNEHHWVVHIAGPKNSDLESMDQWLIKDIKELGSQKMTKN